jgi:hypothetical protein
MNEAHLEAARAAAAEFIAASRTLQLWQAEARQVAAGTSAAPYDVVLERIASNESIVVGRAEVLRLALGALE